MRRRSTTLAIASLLTFASGACSETKPPNVPPPTTATAATTTPTQAVPVVPSASAAASSSLPMTSAADSTAFSWNAYGALRGNRANYVFSGVSLQRALAMAALGARGNTKAELDSVLGRAASFEPGQDAKGTATLRIANRLWVDEQVKVQAAYGAAVDKAYHANIVPVPFRSDSEKSRGTINAWVKDETAGKVTDLLPKGSVSPTSRLVITNAVYFKASWSAPFSPSSTLDQPFTDEAGKERLAPMMHKEGTLRASEIANAKLVELPYKDTDLVMTLLVPNDPKGLRQLEATLTADTFAAHVSTLSPKYTKLALPRFSFRVGGKVNEGLQKLGIREAFTQGKADFGAMLEGTGEPVLIDSVFHDAFIAVDEHGTEAAAATAVVMSVRGMPLGKPFEVRADRAFLFAIRNPKSGEVLFLGRVGDPAPTQR
ncbi:MAG: serpin family protein [Polyangiaceae bacterium]